MPSIAATVENTSAASSFTTPSISAPSSGVLVVAITTRSTPAVTDISGLGATWTLAHAQDAARTQIRQEVWIGEGASGSGGVSITLQGAVNSAVQVVAVDDVDGWSADVAVTAGTDTDESVVTATVTEAGSLVIGCCSGRNAIHTAGVGLTENVMNTQQDPGGGSTTSLSTAYADGVDSNMTVAFDHSFVVDWVQGAVVLWEDAAPGGTYDDVILADSPVGYWPLGDPDGSQWVQDLSGNEHHGSYTAPEDFDVVGGPMPDSDARLKLATVAMANLPVTVVENAGGYSLEFWIRIDTGATVGNNDYILSEGSSSAYGTVIRHATDAFSGWHRRADGTLGITAPSPAYTVDVWYHVVGTYDPAADQWRVYVNSVQAGNAITSVDTYAIANRYIRAFGATHHVQGHWGYSMSHVAAYDYPLTAQQVADHYAARTLASPPPTPLDLPNRYEQTDPRFYFEGPWLDASHASRSGGNAKYTQGVNARCTVNFRGDTFRWIATTQADRGLAEVRIDGVLVDTVDLYSSGTVFQAIVFAVDGLSAGNHVAVIRCLGQNGQGTGNPRIEVDAIEVRELLDPPPPPPRFEQDDPRVRLGTGYSEALSASYSGGSGVSTWSPNSSALITFDSDYIRVIGLLGPGRGAADFYIDGVFIEQVVEDAPTWSFDTMIFERYDLGPGPHSLWIIYRANAVAGSGFTLDAFETDALYDPGDRFEHDDPLIVHDGTVTSESVHSDGSALLLSGGQRVRFWTSGPNLRLLGAVGPGFGDGVLTIDGVPQIIGTTFAEIHYQYPIFERFDLGPGTHAVEWRPWSGTVSFDAVEADALVEEPPPEPIEPGTGQFYVLVGGQWVAAGELRHRNPDNNGWLTP